MMQHLSEHETNDLIFRLEEHKYGRRFNSMQLAQKANVPLDAINRIENQLPIDDPRVMERIARTLGVTPDLLRRIAGLEEISTEDLHQLDQCLISPGAPGAMAPECERVGLRG